MNKYISPNSKIKIEWTDLPENYTAENRAKIKNHFAKKYGVDKSSIQHVFHSAKKDTSGNLIEITGATLDNILDINYQHQLFKAWLEREGLDVEYSDLIEFDKKITQDLKGDYEQATTKKWDLKWLKINNFLAFGKDNELNLDKNKGFTIISSAPANFGGKSTAIVDSIKFLFIGKTTKTDKNEEVFNRYLNDDKLSVKGLVEMNGELIIIERILTRKAKKSGGWTIKTELKLTKLMPDGSEQDLQEQDSVNTTQEIKKMVGDENIFDLNVLTTGDNLMQLISSTPTENGKLLNSLIGLSVIEEKEALARSFYNNWKKTKLANRYDTYSLFEEITTSKEHLEMLEGLLERNEESLNHFKDVLKTLNDSKDTLLSTKRDIDPKASNMSQESIESDIEVITHKGTEISNMIKDVETNIVDLMGYEYDEVKYHDKHNDMLTTERLISESKTKHASLTEQIDTLLNDEFCKTCTQRLPEIDNSDKIATIETEIKEVIENINKLENDLEEINKYLEKVREDKVHYDNRCRFELQLERLKIDRQQCVIDYKTKKSELDFYIKNEEVIKTNAKINLDVDVINTKISETNHNISILGDKNSNINLEVSRSNDKILENEELIKGLNDEAKLDIIYETYIKMVGRNGVTKIVIRSLIPLINSELERVMEDSLEIKLNFDINEKNEVELNIVDGDIIRPVKGGSGYEKTIASLALRCVLTKVSQLPTPNFIVFDEIFGKVSPDNYDKVKLFFDKVSHLFDNIFLIVHDERLTEWGDNHILIEKTNNVSKIVG